MTFLDLDVFDIAPHFESPNAGLVDSFTFESKGFGVATPWQATGTVRRTAKLPILMQGIDKIGALRQFFTDHKGRQRPFWLPAYVNDFVVLTDDPQSNMAISIDGHEFSKWFALGNQFRFIALLTRSGKMECYGVTAVTNAGLYEILTLSRGLDTALIAAETVCCPLLLVRFAEDSLEYDYVSGDVIKGEIDFLEVPQEYPDAATNQSGTETAHLGTRQVFLYRITDGTTTLRLADYGIDLSAAALTWTAADISHDQLSSSWDMLGDRVSATLRSDDPSHPLRRYLNEYNLPNFTVEIFTADLDDPGALDLASPDHLGRLEAVDFETEGAIRMDIASMFRMNERELPTVRMQRTCNWRTFQQGCGAVEADFTTAGTISVISQDPAYIEAAAFGAKATAMSDPNWFALGKVTVGMEKRLCTGQFGNRLYLNFPFVSAVVGADVSAVAGDDKRVGTCDTKFGQLANHSGAPYMPNSNPQIEPLKTPSAGGGKKG